MDFLSFLFPLWTIFVLECNAEPKRRYNIPILSGSAYVGQLYDARTDRLLHDRFLWETAVTREKDVTSVFYDMKNENSLMDRIDNMNMDQSLKLSFMTGLLTVRIFSNTGGPPDRYADSLYASSKIFA